MTVKRYKTVTYRKKNDSLKLIFTLHLKYLFVNQTTSCRKLKSIYLVNSTILVSNKINRN